MPKQSVSLGTFHGGLNLVSSERDVLDAQLIEAKDCAVDKLGQITTLGGTADISSSISDQTSSTAPGYGLFHWKTDYRKVSDDDIKNILRVDRIENGADEAVFISPSHSFNAGNTVYITDSHKYNGVYKIHTGSGNSFNLKDVNGTAKIQWRGDSTGKVSLVNSIADDSFYALCDYTSGEIDVFSKKTEEWFANEITLGGTNPEAVYYAADGALRVSDGTFTSGRNKWYGHISRTLFPNSMNPFQIDGFFARNQALSLQTGTFDKDQDAEITLTNVSGESSGLTIAPGGQTAYISGTDIHTACGGGGTRFRIIRVKVYLRVVMDPNARPEQGTDWDYRVTCEYGESSSKTAVSSTPAFIHAIEGNTKEEDADDGYVEVVNSIEFEALAGPLTDASGGSPDYHTIAINQSSLNVGEAHEAIEIVDVGFFRESASSSVVGYELNPGTVQVDYKFEEPSSGTANYWDTRWAVGMTKLYGEGATRQESMLKTLRSITDSGSYIPDDTVSSGESPNITLTFDFDGPYKKTQVLQDGGVNVMLDEDGVLTVDDLSPTHTAWGKSESFREVSSTAVGPELIASDPADNRTFNNDTGNWETLDASGSDVAIANASNKLQVTTQTDNEVEGAQLPIIHVGNGSATSVVAGRTYRVSMKLQMTTPGSGTFSMKFGLGGRLSSTITMTTSEVTYTKDILVANATGALLVQNVSATATVFTIDDVSVKEITSGSGSGVKCTTVTNSSGAATFIITTPGTGYGADNTILFTDPGAGSETATLTIASVGVLDIGGVGKLEDDSPSHTAWQTDRSHTGVTQTSTSGSLSPEMIAGDNDNTDLDTVGDWVPLDASGSDVTVAVSGGKLVVTTQTDNEIEGAQLPIIEVGDGSSTAVVAGRTYRVSMDLELTTPTTGIFTMIIGIGGTLSQSFNINTDDKTYNVDIVTADNTGALKIYNTSSTATVFTVDNVSVKEIIGGSGAQCSIDTDGAGAATFTVTTAGTGYTVGDTILFTDPGSTTNTATIIVKHIESALLVDNGSGGPAGVAFQSSSSGNIFNDGFILVDKEVMQVTAVSSETLTVTRGLKNSSLVTHANNSLMYHINISEWDPRVTGVKLYMKDVHNLDDKVWKPQVTFDFLKGTGIITRTGDEIDILYNVNKRYYCSIPRERLLEPNLVGNFSDETGIDFDEKSTSAQYKTATLMNGRVYIGNVNVRMRGQKQAVRMGDTILRSPFNKFDIFPFSNRMDVAINDGEHIVKLESFNDRLLCFKEETLYIINLSGNVEIVEGVYRHRGVQHPAQVFQTDFGVAWANRIGVFLYDGQRVTNLTEKQGQKLIDWPNEIGSSETPMVGYTPKNRQIIIFEDIAAAGTYVWVFDLDTRSWVRGTNDAPGTHATNNGHRYFDINKTNFVIDHNEDLIFAQSPDASSDETHVFSKWTDTPQTADDFDVRTKEIDFGSPAIRKKIYAVHVSYQASSPTAAVVTLVAQTGSSTTTYTFLDGTAGGATSTLYNGQTLDTTGGVWMTAILKPSTSIKSIYSAYVRIAGTNVHSSFKINDISIIYRAKPVK